MSILEYCDNVYKRRSSGCARPNNGFLLGTRNVRFKISTRIGILLPCGGASARTVVCVTPQENHKQGGRGHQLGKCVLLFSPAVTLHRCTHD